jgi:hypothetical protein
MKTSTKTKTRTKTLIWIAAAAGLVAAAGFAAYTLNPKFRQYLTPKFRPYQILPGYVVPGYTPGYVPGYRR